jgi:trehalose 6-phosphate phosphatase
MTATSPATPHVDPEILGRCLEVLNHTPAGLVTDVDGTISPIAPTPAEASVDPLACASLERLNGGLALLGIVTGRAAANAEAMVALPGLVYVGNHGMERRHNGVAWTHPGAAAGGAAIGAALREFAAEAHRLGHADGVIVEDKGVSGSIHYRLAPDHDAAHAALLPLAVAAAERHGLTVTSGRNILELRPSIVVNKGTAIVELVAAHRLRGIIFLGDDLTDVDGFKALRVLRQAGEVATLLVAVLSAETHADVLAHTDVTVDGVTGCAALLAAIADALGCPPAAPRQPLSPSVAGDGPSSRSGVEGSG